MTGRSYVFQDTIQSPTELRARYRTFGRSKTLLLPHRPNLSIGDLVHTQLLIESHQARVRISGAVRRAMKLFFLDQRNELCFELALTPESAIKLSPILTDSKKYKIARRFNKRQLVQRWAECRSPNEDLTRSARIVDISPKGVFLSSGLSPEEGKTILFKPHQAPQWLAGVVRWRGEKHDTKGVGLEVVFSRAAERAAWNEWFIRNAPQL